MSISFKKGLNKWLNVWRGNRPTFFRGFVDGRPIANAVTNSTDWEREAHAFLSFGFERLVRLPWKRYNGRFWNTFKWMSVNEIDIQLEFPFSAFPYLLNTLILLHSVKLYLALNQTSCMAWWGFGLTLRLRFCSPFPPEDVPTEVDSFSSSLQISSCGTLFIEPPECEPEEAIILMDSISSVINILKSYGEDQPPGSAQPS